MIDGICHPYNFSEENLRGRFGCIFTHRIFGDVYAAVEARPGVKEVEVVPCWTPVWTEERLNQKARSALADSRYAMFRIVKRSAVSSQPSAKTERRRDIPR